MTDGLVDYLAALAVCLTFFGGLGYLLMQFCWWSEGKDREAIDNAAIERLARESLRTYTVQTRDCTEIMARVYRDYSEREYQR